MIDKADKSKINVWKQNIGTKQNSELVCYNFDIKIKLISTILFS